MDWGPTVRTRIVNDLNKRVWAWFQYTWVQDVCTPTWGLDPGEKMRWGFPLNFYHEVCVEYLLPSSSTQVQSEDETLAVPPSRAVCKNATSPSKAGRRLTITVSD